MISKCLFVVTLSCVAGLCFANQSSSPTHTLLSKKEVAAKESLRDPFFIPLPNSKNTDGMEKAVLSKKTSNRTVLRGMKTELITLKYAQADDFAQLIDGADMLSERGKLSVDKRTNTILVRDLASNISAVKQIVRSLDVPIKQVQIEARIVTVDEGHLEELGVRWGLSRTNRTTGIDGSIEDNNFDEATIDQILNVNLGSPSINAASIAFKFAILGSDVLLDLELSAMQSESKAEVISRPRLMTTNKQPAYIEQGTEIPYFESSESGETRVEFKKAVLSLNVTPQILPDDRLILDLSVTQDRPGSIVKTGTGEAIAINTQKMGTQVLVNNGQTVVLGGIYQYSLNDSKDSVPLLGDIPFLGGLFRRTYQNIAKSELLIFVTPTIVPESDFSEVRK